MPKKRILIVDDDAGMRHTIKRLLAFDGKFDIEEASDGFSAETKIEEFLPDLIILDIRMPGKDGYEVCLNVRKKPEMHHVKIVAVSGIAGDTGDAIISALGADYFFEKPFDSKKFKKKIRELLEEA